MTTARRRFLATTASTALAEGTTAIAATRSTAQPKVRWRMSTTWTAVLDQLQRSAQLLAKVVDEMSAGRFQIEVFPGGQIMPPLDCFEATSRGTIEAFMGTSTYWSERSLRSSGSQRFPSA